MHKRVCKRLHGLINKTFAQDALEEAGDTTTWGSYSVVVYFAETRQTTRLQSHCSPFTSMSHDLGSKTCSGLGSCSRGGEKEMREGNALMPICFNVLVHVIINRMLRERERVEGVEAYMLPCRG